MICDSSELAEIRKRIYERQEQEGEGNLYVSTKMKMVKKNTDLADVPELNFWSET